ncbi:hypothetical protein QP028_00710 [Corynebacterium suedekumii]|nr:hypothetical protein QP028_00710 [Corynebacterium suedekumii]
MPGIPGSQRLLRFSAWFQAAMFGLFVLLGFLVPHHSLIITAWMATLGALLAAILLIPHLRRDRWRSLLGLLASASLFRGLGFLDRRVVAVRHPRRADHQHHLVPGRRRCHPPCQRSQKGRPRHSPGKPTVTPQFEWVPRLSSTA